MAAKTARTRKKTTKSHAAAAKTPRKRRTAADGEDDGIGARRPVWKGSVSFGLIDIPVALRSAEKKESLGFTMLDKKDFAPIKYERVSSKTGKPVAWDDIVKGYQYEKGEYVVVSEQELQRADPEATQSVDIVAFVGKDEIAPEFLEKPYVLEPQKRGRKGYALLREVLARTDRVGVARVVIKTRQYLAALIPRNEVLLLQLVRWADEVLDLDAVHLPGVDAKSLGITQKELDMASMLVEGMVEEWDPSRYHDEYREAVMAMIEETIESGNVHAADTTPVEPKPERGPEVVDFMSLLKKSLEQKAGAGAKSAAARRGARREEDDEAPRRHPRKARSA